MAVLPAQQPRQRLGMGRAVIHPGDEGIFVADAPAGLGKIIFAALHQPGNVVLLIHRHNAAAGLIIGRVQRDGKGQPQPQLRQLVNAVAQAAGGKRNMPQAQVSALRRG